MARVLESCVEKVPSLRETYPALAHILTPVDLELHVRGWVRGAANLLCLCLCAERVQRIELRHNDYAEYAGHLKEISKTLKDRYGRMVVGKPPPSVLSGPLRLKWNPGE